VRSASAINREKEGDLERKRLGRGERNQERERENLERERERDWTGEREREDRRESSGGLLPPCSRTAPPLGALGLAAGQATPGGGAGRRRPPAGGSGAGHSQERGRERGGLSPPSAHAQGAQVGPLVAHGRRHAAGGAQTWGGAGHPKKRGKERGFGFGGGEALWWWRRW